MSKALNTYVLHLKIVDVERLQSKEEEEEEEKEEEKEEVLGADHKFNGTEEGHSFFYFHFSTDTLWQWQMSRDITELNCYS